MSLHELVAIVLITGAICTVIGAALGFYAAASAHERSTRDERESDDD